MSRTSVSFRKTTPVALILLAGLSSLAHAEHVLLLATGSSRKTRRSNRPCRPRVTR